MRNSLLTPPALVLALTLAHLSAASPIPSPSPKDSQQETQSLYTVVDEETGTAREKGLSSGIIAGIVVAAVLGFSLLFGLLWCWLDKGHERRSRSDTTRSAPARRLWPWAGPPSPDTTTPMRQTRDALGARTSSTSTTTSTNSNTSSNTTSGTGSSGRTAVGSISSVKPISPPTSPRASLRASPRQSQLPMLTTPSMARASRLYSDGQADRGREDERRRRESRRSGDRWESRESLPQYVQVVPPPKALEKDHGRVAEWCAKTAAKIEGRDRSFDRVKSWEEGDPENTRPDPFTA